MRKKIFYLAILVILITAALPVPVARVALADDDLGLRHDSHDSLYRTPSGAVPLESTVTLRLRALTGAVDAVTLRLYDVGAGAEQMLPMTVANTTPDGYDFWEVNVDTGRNPTIYQYRFIVVTTSGEIYFYEDDYRTLDDDEVYHPSAEGGLGAISTQSRDLNWQLTTYDSSYYTPEWMRNAVVYQIMPDRFRNGDPGNDPADDSLEFYDGLRSIFHETWNESPVDPRAAGEYQDRWNVDFFGGDLAGITEKLDYLQDLGVTALYLNPIFESRSNHRYDTADYKAIDPILGTEEDFATLVAEAEKRGMVLILDGVFNHLSSDSPFFDRYGRYEEVGACESLDSVYRNWFYFTAPSGQQPSVCVDNPSGATFYESWAGYDSIPRINNDRPEPRLYFFTGRRSVVATWGQAGIGGWRLDVGGDIDGGLGDDSNFWEGFRVAVRNANPEGVIIGEEWNNATRWLLGNEWDSVMNYRLRRGILGFVRDEAFVDNDANGDNVIYALTPAQLDRLIRDIESDYPPAAYHAMMNILGSHDTSRLSFVAGTAERQKLATLLLFALPGAPTIYYADEIAIDAPSIDDNGTLQDDPYNRAPYPWPDTEGDTYGPADEDMLAFYQSLSALRHANSALREGEMITLVADSEPGVYAFLRVDAAAGNAALVALNNSDAQATATVDLAGLLPANLALEPAFDGEALSTGGEVSITLTPGAGNIWTLSVDAPFDTLPAPEMLGAQGAAGSVSLEWDAVPGAAGYVVYRSPVASGGFESVSDVVAEPAFVDEDVVNGFKYFYSVAAVSADGVVGSLAASQPAIPSAQITATSYLMDDEPAEVTLAYGLAATVRAAVTVSGEMPGMRAEAALLPAGTDLADAAWLPMTLAAGDEGQAVYEAAIPVLTAGEYEQVARFSGSAGESWTLVVTSEATFPPLTVNPPDDADPPAPPETAVIAQASVLGVELAWTASPSEDVAAYRVYRTQGRETLLVGEVLSSDEAFFFDKQVTQGVTYTYAVTAVDNALNESEPVSAGEATPQRQRVPVTFVAVVPDYTDQGAGDVYLAGDLGAADLPFWDPAGVKMTRMDATTWTVTLEIPEGSNLQYKYARGTWDAVEKSPDCEEIANRTLSIERGSAALETRDVIAKWRDLDNCG